MVPSSGSLRFGDAVRRREKQTDLMAGAGRGRLLDLSSQFADDRRDMVESQTGPGRVGLGKRKGIGMGGKAAIRSRPPLVGDG